MLSVILLRVYGVFVATIEHGYDASQLMPAPENLKDRLRALGAAPTRSSIRRMADVLPEIELALSLGASRTAVVEALNDGGIPMTMTTFAANLYRLRKAPRQLGAVLAQPAASTPRAAMTPGAEAPHRYGQHDPRRLDDVMRTTPDMKALARLATKGHR